MKTAPIIRELNLNPTILKQVNQLLGDGLASKYYRKTKIRDIIGVPFCASCDQVPEVEVSYTEDDVKIISHWCRPCYEQSLTRTKEESQSSDIANFYGCTKAPENYFGGPSKHE